MLANYGVLLASRHRLVEAEQKYRRAVDILRACCGEDHPDLAARLADHAYILRKLDRKVEAASTAAVAKSLKDRHATVNVGAFTVDVRDLR
jgi:hypothetical protein